MRIVIETDSATPLSVATAHGEATQPPAQAESAGAGPLAFDSPDGPQAATALDTGGPPEWLTAAIARAMNESDLESGEFPASADAAAHDGGGAPPLA